jgi:hypothetical protein
LYAKEQHTMKFNVVIRSCKADLALLPPCYKKVGWGRVPSKSFVDSFEGLQAECIILTSYPTAGVFAA